MRSIRALRLLYPEYDFSLLIGSDNLRLIDRWYDYQRLLRIIPLHVYPRPGYPLEDIDPVALPEAMLHLHPELHRWTWLRPSYVSRTQWRRPQR